MKKKLIFGSLLAVFLLAMLPSVAAVEFNAAVEANESRILDEFQNMNIDELKEKILKMNVEEEQLKELQKQLKDDTASPQCMRLALKLMCMLIHIFVKILLLPLKIMLIPLKILFMPLKIICGILRIPFKIIGLFLHIILPDTHHHCNHHECI